MVQPIECESASKEQELKKAIELYSHPEFRNAITRLFGEAKDQAIRERNERAAEAERD